MTASPKPNTPLRRNLTQQMVAQLSARIRRGKLKPGDKLPTESEFVSEFGVSRTVVREAMSRLQAAGLVETHHGIGTFVLQSSAPGAFRIDPAELATVKDVLGVMELRIGLESETAALAAVRRTPEQLAAMRRALDDMGRNIEMSGDTVSPDFRFHLEVALASGNRHYRELMNSLGPLIIPRTRLNTAKFAEQSNPSYLKGVNREHEAIYEAIASGDADAARAAMRAHLANSCERLKRAHARAVPAVVARIRKS
jgi:DNA-binding FadR family transcriptional regulator